MKKRLLIYCHYNSQPEIQPYVVFFLKEMHKEVSDIVFLSNSPFPELERQKIDGYVKEVRFFSNQGFDFYCWKCFLEKPSVDLGLYDELILTNSSIAGPVFPLDQFFKTMDKRNVDFWGVSENYERQYHVQSYFLAFRPSVFLSEAFRRFWESVQVTENKEDAINSYEIKLTHYFSGAGFTHSVFYSSAAGKFRDMGIKYLFKKEKHSKNPTLVYPCSMLKNKVPFVKIQLLRENPRKTDMKVLNKMIKSRYDLSLVPGIIKE